MTYRELTAQLATRYPQGEAKAIVRLLLEEGFGLSYADIVCNATEQLPYDQQQRLTMMMQRLTEGEPVQYVLGKADFCGHTFLVAPGVLIPRPETELLCGETLSFINSRKWTEAPSILDIGTGSGCIAISLALELGTEGHVEAIDISPEAIAIASHNAQQLHADVIFRHADILAEATESKPFIADRRFDIIISNPPYIAESEAADMEQHVLQHEPHTALFVPDSDPLLFYRAIARFAHHNLSEQGILLFEINSRFAAETCAMLAEEGYKATAKKDQFGLDRMVMAFPLGE